MNLPAQFLERMKNDLGDEYPGFVSQYDKEPQYALRVNTLKIESEDFLHLVPFCKEPVPWCGEGFYYDGKKGRHPAFSAGLFYSQEATAQIAAELLDVHPGEKVLDLCAAPGGKSTQIAAKLRGEGLLVSNEINEKRCKILRENIERMGIKNAVITNMYPEKLEKYFGQFFDKIMVDAPCSGEGMFRKDPAAVREWSAAHTHSCAVRQIEILKTAFSLLSGGGRLVYSTCTFSRAENEEVCRKILDEVLGIRLTEVHRLMPHKVRGEGHFSAVFEKDGEKAQRELGGGKYDKAAVKCYRDFERENLNTSLCGDFLSFGDFLYLAPKGIGSLNLLRCLSAGLCLGEYRKGRFIPAHHLCMALSKEDFKRTISLTESEIPRYLCGEEIEREAQSGFGAMLYADKYPLGWYKLSGKSAKNHYPKYLRGR